MRCDHRNAQESVGIVRAGEAEGINVLKFALHICPDHLKKNGEMDSADSIRFSEIRRENRKPGNKETGKEKFKNGIQIRH